MPDPSSTTANPLVGRPWRSSGLLDLLRSWLPAQRWFPAKGTTGDVEPLAVVELTDPAGEAEVGLHLVRLPSGAVLQVPLVIRHDDDAPAEGVPVVGRLDDGRVVVDGCHDPAFVRAWLASAERDAGVRSGDPAAAAATMRVVSGEQSNTSVLLPDATPPGILKVFRGVGAGANPDVEVPLALSHVGWSGVPRPLAWLTGAWPGGDGTGRSTVAGHLGVLSELVVGAEDGFELACRMAGAGESFGALAADLGRTTAEMHDALRRAVPVPGPQVPAPADDVVRTLRARAAAAVAAAPVLADRADAVDRVLSSVTRLGTLPPLQRVHGDYHLGQVLHSSARGWSVLDFEGEPQASPEERMRPDLPMRDLAGMLRSLDYAAAVGGATSPEWDAEARARLVDGYLTASGGGTADDVTLALLRALELDKALYEVVYEVRNRPTWVPIPLAGVDRLLQD
ncbi:phosphotransferase [Actinotalea sp. AC32]|nr:phosphotransferase [Actinotalea sp. AC32]